MESVTYNKIKVFFDPKLDGGGRGFGQDYIPFLKKSFPAGIDTVCEFGCGPGFIGFSILAHGICKNLVLIDINPEAVKVCEKTIAENKLANARVYLSDGLSKIPESEKWDLVVSNPPHFDGTQEQRKNDIRTFDPGWVIHKQFYKDVGKHLTENGLVIFQENTDGSTPDTFKRMVEENGFTIKESAPSRHTMEHNVNRMLTDIWIGVLHGQPYAFSPKYIYNYLAKTPKRLSKPYNLYFLKVSKK